MTDLDQARTQEQTARIRGLNDQLRISHTGGTLVTTPGVLALGIYLNQAILIAIAAYNDFDEDNDPFGEHDFGLVEVAGQEVLFKIDYYDNDLNFRSGGACQSLPANRRAQAAVAGRAAHSRWYRFPHVLARSPPRGCLAVSQRADRRRH